MTAEEWYLKRYADAKLAYAALMKFYPLTSENLPNEEWLPIPDWEDYHGSNFGRVKSFKQNKQRILKPQLNRGGYLYVQLYKNTKYRLFFLHRLVAELFIPNPQNKPQVNHVDGNPFNNHVSNLEWATQEENMLHAVRTDLAPSGQDNYQAKLTNNQAQYIRANPDGLTQRKLAEIFGVNQGAISNIQLGKIWKRAGGVVRQSKAKRIPAELKAQIRAEYVFGSAEFGTTALAKKYGIGETTVWTILHKA